MPSHRSDIAKRKPSRRSTPSALDRRLSGLLDKPHRDGRLLCLKIAAALRENGPVNIAVKTTLTIASAKGEAVAIELRSDATGVARLVKRGRRGTPSQVDHPLGYFLSRVTLADLQKLKPVLRQAHREGLSKDAAFEKAAPQHDIVSRVQRAGLDQDAWDAAIDAAAIKDALLWVAAKLVYDEWLEAGAVVGPLGPLPKPSVIVRRKSLRGAYERMFNVKS